MPSADPGGCGGAPDLGVRVDHVRMLVRGLRFVGAHVVTAFGRRPVGRKARIDQEDQVADEDAVGRIDL